MSDIDTSKRILLKAHELFMQYGVRSISMDDIANKLGISKKTIYLYYADKDTLVAEVMQAIIEDNQNACNAHRKASQDAIHEVFLAMEMIKEMFRSMNPSVLFDMQKYHPSAFQLFYNYKNDYLYGVIRDNIVRGIKEKLFRADIKVDILARFRVESIMLPFTPDFYTRMKFNLAVIEEELIIHFLFGLVSQKGYKIILKYQQGRTKRNNGNEKTTAK